MNHKNLPDPCGSAQWTGRRGGVYHCPGGDPKPSDPGRIDHACGAKVRH